MLTSKERAELRARANTLDTTLIVGKEGVTQAVAEEADTQLTARELVKGRVLEGALMTAREACDALCEATGADGIACIGSKFVIYRFSEKCQAQRNETGRAKRKPTPASKADPVRKGARARRQAMKQQREQRNAYFKEKAIERAIERDREKQLRNSDCRPLTRPLPAGRKRKKTDVFGEKTLKRGVFYGTDRHFRRDL